MYIKGAAEFEIYIRCAGLHFRPANTGSPAFGVKCCINDSHMGLSPRGLDLWPPTPLERSNPLGNAEGYNFRIIDRGVMYPVQFEVERTGEDGVGDHVSKKLSMQLAYHKDPSK